MTPWFRHLCALLLSVLISIVPATTLALAAPALSLHTLPNGLRVVILEDHASPVVAVNVWVHAGGKDEEEWLSGYSHYLEHLTARGTKKRKPLQDRLDIFHVGGQNSANTYFDRTQYYNVVRKEHFDLALDSLADTMQNAQLPREGIEAERQVVTEELRRFLDNPGTASYRETFRLAFGTHPYARPVIGSFATLNGLRRDDFYRYYKAMYAPNNIVLAIAGDVDARSVLPKVREAFKNWRKNPALPPHPRLPAAFRGYQTLTQRQPLKRAEVTLAFMVPGWRHPDRPALDVMARLLGGNTSSRLWQAVVEREELASEVGASNFTLEDLGLVYVSGYPKRPADAFKLKAAMLREIGKLRESGVIEGELARIKRQVRLLQLFQGEEVLSRAQDLGESALYGGVRYETDWLSRFEAVDAAAVKDVATRYLVEENLTSVQTLPGDAPGPSPADEQACAEAVRALSGGQIKPTWLDFGKVTFTGSEASTLTGEALAPAVPASGAHAVVKRVLDNGLTVLFKRRPGRPLVGVAFHARAGSSHDPAGKEGMAQLLADLLPKGTASLSQEVVAAKLDEWGGNYSIGADRDLIYGSITLSREDARDGLALFSELLTAPALDAAEFKKEQASARARLERRADDLNAQAGDLWAASIFAASPYDHPPQGTVSGIDGIDREALVAFHRAAVQPDRSVLTVVGDLTQEELDAILEATTFPAWKAVSPGLARSPAPPRPVAGKKNKEMDKLQSQVIVGAPAVARDHPDYTDLRVLTSLVGFRCFVDLVYNKPMAYSTGGMASLLQGAGAVSLYIGVAEEKTDAAISELHAKWRDVRDRDVQAEELGHIKDRLIGGQAIADQRSAALAGNYGAYEAYGLGYDYYDRQNALIRKVTASRLRALAKKYLAPGRLLTVVVGPTAGGAGK